MSEEHEHNVEDHLCLADMSEREELTDEELAELDAYAETESISASSEEAEASSDVEASGITVRHDWRTANYGPYPMSYPIGIMMHHTAGRRAGDLPTLTRKGTGVSANAYITKDGTIFVLAPFSRRAWHAGRPDRGTGYVNDGNRYYYGIEIENLGDGRDPYTRIQIDAIVAHCRWLCQAHNITHPGAMIRHRDFAPSRKIDTSDNFPFAEVKRRTFSSAPKPEPPTDTVHRVQSGAFGERENADRREAQLKRKGFDAYVTRRGNYWTVQAGAFESRENADDLARRLEGAGFGAYVYQGKA